MSLDLEIEIAKDYKKQAFLRTCARELRLPNYDALPLRLGPEYAAALHECRPRRREIEGCPFRQHLPVAGREQWRRGWGWYNRTCGRRW